MKYIQVNPNIVNPVQADWQQNVLQLKDKVLSLDYVKTNPHKEHQALEWLTCICKVHPKVVANTFIEQAAGLGAQEMRALSMHDSDTYFPSLSAAEIYKSKRLEAFPVRTSLSKGQTNDSWIQSAVRDVLQQKLDGYRDKTLESLMLQGNSWLKSRPSAFFKTNLNGFITDIEVNKGANITPDSEFRLHYHNIVAEAVGATNKANVMLRVNLTINPQQLETLSLLAGASTESKASAKQLLMATILDSKSEAELDIQTVALNPDVVTSLIQTGGKHWSQITSDVHIPLVKIDKPLPAEISEQYTQLSKELVVAMKTSKVAGEIAKSKRSAIIELALSQGLTENTQSPNDLTHLRTGTKLDSKRLFDDLTSLGVQPDMLRKREVNEEAVLALFDKAQGGAVDVTSAIKYKGLDNDKLKAAAKVQGIEVAEYQTTSITPYTSSQSRGPVADKMQEITSMISDRTASTMKSISASQILDHNDLTSNLKNTGVSKQMTTTTYQEF